VEFEQIAIRDLPLMMTRTMVPGIWVPVSIR
jgi:hypothetical protein